MRNEPLRQPREDDELPRPAKRHSPALSPPDPDRTLKGRGASPNLDRVSCKAPSSTPVTPAQPIPGRNAPRSPKVHRRNEPSPRWIATPSLQRRAQHSTRTWQDARIPLAIGDTRRRDGAFMEPSGRNRWQPTATVPERMVRRGSTVRVRQRALKIPAKRGFLLSDLVQPGTSLARRGSRVGGGSTTQRVAGNHQRFHGAPTELRSWGQVLGTNDGWLGPNGSSARAIDAQ